jgi:hypothetical protein
MLIELFPETKLNLRCIFMDRGAEWMIPFLKVLTRDKSDSLSAVQPIPLPHNCHIPMLSLHHESLHSGRR